MATIDAAKIPNTTRHVTALFAVPSTAPLFQVQAIAEITTAHGRIINPGDVLTIDPTLTPEHDQMVLVGDSIQPFAKQQHQGVATSLASSCI
jgi:hypothetical protein